MLALLSPGTPIIVNIDSNELAEIFKTMSDNLFLSKTDLMRLTGLNLKEADCIFRRQDISAAHIGKTSIMSIEELCRFISSEKIVPIKRYAA